MAQDKQLNLFIWSEYLPPEVVTAFEKKYQCKVVIDLYEEAESMMAKVQAGGSGVYDVVAPPDYLIPAMAKLQLLAPLRHENLPNLKNLDKKFLNPPYDSKNQYSVPYQWGTVGIYARKAEGKPQIDSWNAFFQSADGGKIILLDSMRDLIGAALKSKGYPLNSTDPKHLKEARDLIVAAKARSVGFAGSVGSKNKVLGKGATAAIVYSGEAARGMAEDPETYYVIPKEGSQIWVDNLAILAKAPHRDLAEKFINFVLEAEIGAQISNFTQFSTPNAASKRLIDPELLKNPTIYPPDEVTKKLEFLQDLGRNSRLYDQVWTQIKSR
ncbi:MAG: polyamine ABC transporter substrate-binding protein [Verrucomicrobiales bacterium]